MTPPPPRGRRHTRLPWRDTPRSAGVARPYTAWCLTCRRLCLLLRLLRLVPFLPSDGRRLPRRPLLPLPRPRTARHGTARSTGGHLPGTHVALRFTLIFGSGFACTNSGAGALWGGGSEGDGLSDLRIWAVRGGKYKQGEEYGAPSTFEEGRVAEGARLGARRSVSARGAAPPSFMGRGARGALDFHRRSQTAGRRATGRRRPAGAAAAVLRPSGRATRAPPHTQQPWRPAGR